MPERVFITGGTGYLGTRLIARLLSRGLEVYAVVRPGSEKKLPAGCRMVLGDALAAQSYREHILPGDTLVHLIGVAHPSPSKAARFQAINHKSAVDRGLPGRASGAFRLRQRCAPGAGHAVVLVGPSRVRGAPLRVFNAKNGGAA